MDSGTNAYIALLSIRPQYVQSIISGEKRVEFRRKKFSKSVKYIVIYTTHPIKKITAFFRVSYITQASPTEIWNKYYHIGGIEEQTFLKYYKGLTQAVAIGIDSLRVLSTPVSLDKIFGKISPPQSYIYIREDLFEKLYELV